MITIYTTEYTTHQPYDVLTQAIEDCHVKQLYTNLMRWLALEVAGLFISPVQLMVLCCLVLWPVILA